MSNNEEIKNTEVQATVNTNAKAENKVAKKDKPNKVKKQKDNKPSKLSKSFSELKKVSWPSFRTVVKQTSVVLAVVLAFLLVVFGLDRLCSWLIGLICS